MTALAPSKSRFPELTKYEVLEEIGHGGMATVYRARDRRLGREVAVKVIHPHLRDSREVVSRFNTEARAVAKLRHPNIVEVFDVSEEGDSEQYLVAELLRGTTLRKLVHEHGPMPPEVAAGFAIDLLAAIAHANDSGVVHRDIKPENVLIEHRAARVSASDSQATGGDRVVVKLTDFGIAKLLDAQGVTSTGQVLGSPAHMAPEQIEGGEVDVRADVFGMGVLLYECMVGHLPFEGNNPAQVLRRVLEGKYSPALTERPIVGTRWSAVLDKALAHAPADRFADATDMRDAICAELARLGIGAPRDQVSAWLDDPASFEAAHSRFMIAKLVGLASESRKSGDVLGAAADYNRALAHDPNDAQLLRIVAGLNRAEARGRLARRAGVVVVLMLGLGGIAFGIGRVLRHPTSAIRADVPVVVPIVDPPPLPPEVLTASSTPSAKPVAPVVVRPPAPAVSSVKPIARSVRLDLWPPVGVKVQVDDANSIDVGTGATLPVDGRGHTLAFTCSVCLPAVRKLAAGDQDDAIAVRLTIKPATLVIVGDGNKAYQILQHPEVAARVGPNSVSITSEFERVEVQQLGTPNIVKVQLHAANTVEASFLSP